MLLFALPLILFAALGVWMLRGLLPGTSVNFAVFKDLLDQGRVERVIVRDDVAQVQLTEATNVPVAGTTTLREVTDFSVRLPSSQATPDAPLISQLEARGVNYRFDAPSHWLGILINFLPVLLALGFPVLLVLVVALVLALRRAPTVPR